MKEKETLTLERIRGCNELEGKIIYYCGEYNNYYCPRICYYANQKFEKAKRRLNK